jgi:two-component system, chemotaxis family, chemotaxis protein CheY
LQQRSGQPAADRDSEEPPVVGEQIKDRRDVNGLSEAPQATSGKAKILVCEDNSALSGVVCFNLVRAGFQVTPVANGRQAIEALKNDSFDLVLSDQQMPLMTGIQLCQHIRQLPAHQQTPFILLTAKCMEIDITKLQKTLGLTKALPKPFSPSELVQCIKEALAAGCQSGA